MDKFVETGKNLKKCNIHILHVHILYVYILIVDMLFSNCEQIVFEISL